MCIVCSDWLKGKMTSQEALRALGEMINSGDGQKDHYFKISERIMDKEVPFKESDKEMDTNWERRRYNWQDDNGGD